MRDYFIFDGVSSIDYNAFIYDTSGFDSPKRTYDEYSVPGRNGTLIIKNSEKFENRSLEYNVFIDKDMQENIKRFQAFLLSKGGYKCLEDSINPDYYVKAMISDGVSVDTKNLNKAVFKLTFNCLPELWLKIGEKVRSYNSNGSIDNPTQFVAKPLIRVYGHGELKIGNNTITISEGANEYIDIDCDIQDCFEGLENRNDLVTLTNFPTLPSGTTNFELGEGITKIEITPRWWTV